MGSALVPLPKSVHVVAHPQRHAAASAWWDHTSAGRISRNQPTGRHCSRANVITSEPGREADSRVHGHLEKDADWLGFIAAILDALDDGLRQLYWRRTCPGLRGEKACGGAWLGLGANAVQSHRMHQRRDGHLATKLLFSHPCSLAQRSSWSMIDREPIARPTRDDLQGQSAVD